MKRKNINEEIEISFDDFSEFEDMLKLISKYQNVENEIRLLISEIEYVPNDIDKERFLIYMTDGNYVYMTLNKITKLNTYNSIVDQLEGKHGIIYLDSGDYFEIKEESRS